MIRSGARTLTPALAREAARMGELRRRAMGGCGCSGRSIGSLGGLPSLPPTVTTSAYGQALQTSLNAQGSAVQAQIKAATGVDTTNAKVAQGAAAAATLISNGYNPDSPSDNANLVHAIAGGLCLVPGVGPILGAAVEGLWAIGNAVAAPLQNALASIGLGTPANAPPCATKGQWTAASVLQGNAGELPPMPTGSFAAFVIPSLAYAASMVGDCQKVPPAAAIVDAAVLLWNKIHAGPAVAYYVPAMFVQPGTASPAPGLLLRGAADHVSGSTPAAKAGQNGNVFYAFQPATAGAGEAIADLTRPPSAVQSFWLPFGTSPFNVAQTSVPPGLAVTEPRIVMLNSGALIPQGLTLTMHLAGKTLAPLKPAPITLHLQGRTLTPTAAAAPKPMTTGGKVATAAGLAGAGALAWWLGIHGWKWVSPRWAARLVR